MAVQSVSRRRRSNGAVPLRQVQPVSEVCLELADHSEIQKLAIQFFQVRYSSDPKSQAARLTDQFIQQNQRIFSLLDVRVERDFDGADVLLRVRAGSAVGAVSLRSPTTA